MFKLIILCFCAILISSFCFSADKKYPGFTWHIKGGATTYDLLSDGNNDSLILGRNLNELLAENGLKIYDEVPIIYPKDPYATFLKYDKKAMDKGWMVNTGMFYAIKASQLFDVRSMSASDWRKTIFGWETDIIEKKLYDHDCVSRSKLSYCRRYNLPEMSDEEYLRNSREYVRMFYLPDTYDSLPLDGSYRMTLSRIAKTKPEAVFEGKSTYYLMFLVGSDNTIHGFGTFPYLTKDGSPFKRMKKIGFYIPGDIFNNIPVFEIPQSWR